MENLRHKISLLKKNTNVWWEAHWMDGFNNRLHTDEEKIRELEDTAIIKTKRKTGWDLGRKPSELQWAVGKLHTAQSTCNLSFPKEQGREKIIWRYNYWQIPNLINTTNPRIPASKHNDMKKITSNHILSCLKSVTEQKY